MKLYTLLYKFTLVSSLMLCVRERWEVLFPVPFYISTSQIESYGRIGRWGKRDNIQEQNQRTPINCELYASAFRLQEPSEMLFRPLWISPTEVSLPDLYSTERPDIRDTSEAQKMKHFFLRWRSAQKKLHITWIAIIIDGSVYCILLTTVHFS